MKSDRRIRQLSELSELLEVGTSSAFDVCHLNSGM